MVRIIDTPALLLAGGILALAGCSPSSRSVNLPNGNTGYAISCDGGWASYSDCFEKAGELCGPRGYTLFSKDGQTVPFLIANPYSATMASAAYRSILIGCGAPPPPAQPLPPLT